MRDMNIDDTTVDTVTVTVGSNIVVATAGSFNTNMVGMWFSLQDGVDGNWYQIAGYTDTTHITLENYYQGTADTAAACIIAFVPDIPEDYHQALADYASYRYFLKRKDAGISADFKGLYDEALKDYKSVYASKTTGWTQEDISGFQYNLFNLPPNNVSA
jgi:hypothetical protein